jgi:hypothetical protein
MCSLQEAYNVPSFDPIGLKKKRGCAAPLRQQQVDPYQYPNREEPVFEQFESGTTNGSTPRNVAGSATRNGTYAGQAQDYEYYESDWGIKTGVSAREKFTNPKRPAEKCAPLQAPPYEFPMSAENKKQFASAMKAALNDAPRGMTAPKPSPMREADMDAVSGYMDDDLDQYLQTKDFKAAKNMPTVAKHDVPNADPYDPEYSPFAVTLDKFNNEKGSATKPLVSEVDFEKSTYVPARTRYASRSGGENNRQYIFDLFLFISAGILIILLCDQLFRFGVATGIKETVTLLKPFMENHSKPEIGLSV